MDEVRKLEERVRVAEQSLAEVTTVTKFHSKELRHVRQHLDTLDHDKITPIQNQVSDIHQYMSREKGFHDGHMHFSNANNKRTGIMLSAGVLVLGIITLIVKSL